MTWFNIVKSAKDDAKAYWIEFTDSIGDWHDNMVKTLQGYLKELDRINQTDEKYNELSDLEKEILKPVMDMLRREVDETRKNTLEQIDQITQMQKETRRLIASIEDAPIEIKIQQLVDSFNEVYEDSPPELRPPRVDRKRVEEIIHRLGFEGKGME